MAEAIPHVPVLIDALIAAVAPVTGTWIDGTFGAGGYTRALLAAGAARVIAIDRDPDALARAETWAAETGAAVTLCAGRFGDLDDIAAGVGAPQVDGVVLDIGVSSMQLDEPDRGFSFMRDGPLDMRMEQSGPTAADIVNRASEALLADILFRLGEERASRRIARAIVNARREGPITRTLELSRLIERIVPRGKPGTPHPATRSFQALRIAVNDELGELARGLCAAERALRAGGVLAVVSFHSLEDRIVKRFMQIRSGNAPRANRYAPERVTAEPGFAAPPRPASPDAAEIAANPRARSARLRVARRLDAPAMPVPTTELGLPDLSLELGVAS